MSELTSQVDSHIRILVLAAHAVVRAGMRYMCNVSKNLVMSAEAATTDDAVSLVRHNHTDVAVVDPDSSDVALHAVAELHAAGVDRVLVLTGAADLGAQTRAFELGAAGVVGKDQPEEMLVRAIEKVHAGELWLDGVQTGHLLRALLKRRDPEDAKIATLTKREREVIVLIGQGLNGATIADRLFISEATVRNHLTSILRKLELSNRFELAVYAFRNKLVESDTAQYVRSPVLGSSNDSYLRRGTAEARMR
jgi:DNA-binding NarL/FixJ family response regulator